MNYPLILAPGLPELVVPLLGSQDGGLGGQVLLTVAGPPVALATSLDGVAWTPARLPFALGATGFLRLTRDPAGVASQIGVQDLKAPEKPLPNLDNRAGFQYVPFGGFLALPPGPVAPVSSVKLAALVLIPEGRASVTFRSASDAGGDIDLTVYRWNPADQFYGPWNQVSRASTDSPNEAVTLNTPAAGWYAVEVGLYRDSAGGNVSNPYLYIS